MLKHDTSYVSFDGEGWGWVGLGRRVGKYFWWRVGVKVGRKPKAREWKSIWGGGNMGERGWVEKGKQTEMVTMIYFCDSTKAMENKWDRETKDGGHYGPEQSKIQEYWATRSFVLSHRLLICVLRPACFSCALCFAHSFARSLTPELVGKCN